MWWDMKRIVWFVMAILFTVLVLFVVLKNGKSSDEKMSINEYIPEEEISDAQNRMTIVTLYFMDPETGELVPEARGIDVKVLMDNPYETILKLLIEGSTNSKIGKTIPDGTSVNSVKLNGEELVIDFDEFFVSQYESGSEQQMKMVYSVVNTFLELKEVTSVKFLVNGEKIDGMEDAFVKTL